MGTTYRCSWDNVHGHDWIRRYGGQRRPVPCCRFQAAMQRVWQVLCCAALNCIAPALKGRLQEGGEANASLAAIGASPVFCPLCAQVTSHSRPFPQSPCWCPETH